MLEIIGYIVIIAAAFILMQVLCADTFHIHIIINEKVILNYNKNMEVDITVEKDEEEDF